MILIINNRRRKYKELEKILDKLKVKYITKKQRSYLRGFRQHHKIKGVILTGGGPDLDKEIKVNRIRADICCLINYDVPILGICEGHEIINYACGGEVRSMKKRVKGETLKVNILKKTKIFRGLPDYIHVKENHRDYIMDMPDMFEIIASSSRNRIEGMMHKKRPIFSVQFHPESSGEYGEKIIENFVKICYSS